MDSLDIDDNDPRELLIVVKAKKRLRKEIKRGIEDYSLQNGSRVMTKVLERLSPSEANRVLAHFHESRFERRATHHQYKVVRDEDESMLVLLDLKDDIRIEHRPICLVRRSA